MLNIFAVYSARLSVVGVFLLPSVIAATQQIAQEFLFLPSLI